MELAVKARPGNTSRKAKFPRFKTLESVIEHFGEFSLLADSTGIVIGLWISHEGSKRHSPSPRIGIRLDSIFHPKLVSEIQDRVRQTAARRARQDVEYPVRLHGELRWFAVCAIPLDRGAGAPALYLAARDVTHRIETLHALAEREALLTQAEEIANFGCWELDLKTNRVRLSRQLEKIYELTPTTNWSTSTYWERMHPGDRMRIRQFVEKSFLEGKPFRYVARYCAPDGDVRVHLAHSLPILGDDGKPVRAIGVVQDMTEQAQSHQELRRVSKQLLNEQDNQRRHLARELHESAGQSLAALKMTLGRLREALPENSELAASLLESAVQVADGAVREVRTVSYLLHPPMLDNAGLGPALQWYARGFSERSGISATVEIADPFPRYAQETETTVFRVVQEALTNVHRYSGSTSAEITVNHDDSQLHVTVRDHGCGFPPAEDATHSRAALGVGISGMRERVEQLDGFFELESIPGHGTIVRAVLPAIPVNVPRNLQLRRDAR
jgi:PAS domain S-box-containing protein